MSQSDPTVKRINAETWYEMTQYEEQLEEMVKEMRTLLGTALMDHRGVADYWKKDTKKALDASKLLLTTKKVAARIEGEDEVSGTHPFRYKNTARVEGIDK